MYRTLPHSWVTFCKWTWDETELISSQWFLWTQPLMHMHRESGCESEDHQGLGEPHLANKGRIILPTTDSSKVSWIKNWQVNERSSQEIWKSRDTPRLTLWHRCSLWPSKGLTGCHVYGMHEKRSIMQFLGDWRKSTVEVWFKIVLLKTSNVERYALFQWYARSRSPVGMFPLK